MTRQEFLNELSDIMQLDEVLTGDEVLEDFPGWDSMANLGVLSMFDMEFSVDLSTDDLKNTKTVAGLMTLAGDNISV